MNDSSNLSSKPRLPTGVPGLDAVLHGGLLRGSVTIVQGSPGGGKTVLGNQFAFHLAAGGAHVLYLTLLSESHGRLLSNLSTMSFYDPAAIASHVRYVSAFDTLEREGIKGVLRLLATEARSHKAEAIVLDGLFVLEENAENTREFRKFVNALSLQAEVMDCTVLVLTNSDRATSSPEYTMVDCWIELSQKLHGYRSMRGLQVHKQRGSGFRSGLHTVLIDSNGMSVLPRIETEPLPLPDATDEELPLASTGSVELDAMIHGGVRATSSTLLLGASGLGKTTLGMQFLSAGAADEPLLAFGFYETPDRLLAKADALGLPLRDRYESGCLELLWNAPTELALDRLGHQLLAAVRRRGVRRLLVDGIDGFRQAALHRRRISRFLTALANALRSEGCTALFTMEVPKLFGRPEDFHIDSISAMAENLLLLRYVEAHGALHRAISVVKVRDTAFDASTRGFEIGRGGLRIGAPMQSTDES